MDVSGSRISMKESAKMMMNKLLPHSFMISKGFLLPSP